MKTKTSNKVSTWLPGFNGFYGSWWDDDGQKESEAIEHINEQREEKGLAPITYDDCIWDYEEYYKNLAVDITRTVGHYLTVNGFIAGYEYEKLVSPREYNFANDSIHVVMLLRSENEKVIRDYLRTNKEAFQKYIEGKYSSRSGFISHYSDDVDVWLNDDYLTHMHKLGAVLDFILGHHLKQEENIDNVDCWLYEETTDYNYISPSNYSELVEGK